MDVLVGWVVDFGGFVGVCIGVGVDEYVWYVEVFVG